MNDVIKKIIIIFIFFSVIITIGVKKVFAFIDVDPFASYKKLDLDQNDYKPNQMTTKDKKFVGEKTSDILVTIRNIGIIISVVVLTIIGLKYILSSVDEKASYKENMFPYIIGCALLAGATILPSLIYDIVN